MTAGRLDSTPRGGAAALGALAPPTWLGTLPFLAVVVAWWLLPELIRYPAYMLPPIGAVLDFAWESVRDGSLLTNVAASLARLAAEGLLIRVGPDFLGLL